MGVLAPTMRELGAHFTAMQSALEEKASEFNYLGGTTSLVAGDGRTSGNTILNTMYFRDRESVARFSASGVHMVSLLRGLCESFEEANMCVQAGWNWWSNLKREEAAARKAGKGGIGGSQWVSLGHEVYEAAGGAWEIMNENATPHGLAAAVVERQDEQGRRVWGSAMVEADTGVMRSAKGRYAVHA